VGSGRDGCEHDPARAGELLSTSGVRKPSRLTMVRVWGPRPYLPDPVRVGESVAEAFGALGIEVAIEPTRDSQEYFRRIAAGDADLYLSGWAADTPDPADYLDSVLRSSSIPRAGRIATHGNLSRYANPAMDAALDAFRADPQEGRWQEVARLLRDEAPLLALQYGAAILAHAWKVRNVTASAFGWIPLGEVDLKE
jgi:peptide/nickel transport system substrate-binding protein